MPVTNWAGSVTFGAAAVHRPGSLDALRRLVAARRSIHALGSGHSFSLVADAPQDLVRLDALPPVFALDEARREVTVGAGMRYADVAAELHRAGWALGNLASLPHISVGGSVATGTHGSGDAQRCLAAAVTGLELVGPDGTLSTLRREEDDIFPGAVVALGALGIVTRLTLAVEPAFDMAQRVHLDVPVDEVIESFDAISGAAYSVSVFTDWHRPHAMVWLKRRLSMPGSGWCGGRVATAAVHPVEGVPPSFSTEQLDVSGPWHERLPHFRPELTPGAGEELQSEFFVPRTQAPAAFAALRALGARLAPVLQIAEVRTVRADDLWLSGAYGRDTVTLHFTWVKDWPAVLPVLSEVERHLAPFDARPHWGKLTTDAPSALLARYPHGAQFARLAAKLDPDGKFRNPFLDALLS
ncbi:D-arabinono-1,4-lactone oxidase [Dactylosporangium sp. CA-139114]|uniref:D-arabinono-1,4-lactone oxidase n=1 Tax=Dactylosporangium sp. CA-139114 TaxID=3239931 RepID=UPI003D983DF0